MSVPALPVSINSLQFCFRRVIELVRSSRNPTVAVDSPAAQELTRIADALGFERLIDAESVLNGKQDRFGVTWTNRDTSVFSVTFLYVRSPFGERKYQSVIVCAAVKSKHGSGIELAGFAPNCVDELTQLLNEWIEFLGQCNEAAAAQPGTLDDLKRSEGGKPAADPYAKLRDFARGRLKGQERAVVEALCGSNGELPIANLALKDGIGWDDPKQGFKDVQSRLKPKLKTHGFELIRQDNAAKLVTVRARKRG